MCIICKNKKNITSLIYLTTLDCSGCTQLTEIPPTLVNLVYLICSGCTQLTEIPPTLVNLTTLFCKRCTSLTEIPHPTFVNLTYINCEGCTWMMYNNPNYSSHIIRLKRCQTIVSRYLQRRRWVINASLSLPLCMKDIVLSY